MSLWGKVKHAANKTKKGVEKAGKDIERTGKKAGDAIEDTAKKAAREAERIAKEAENLAMSAIGDVKKLLNDVKNVAKKAKGEIEGVARKAERGITDTANKAKREVEDEARKVEQFAAKAEHAVSEVEDQVEKLPGKADKLITEKLPEAVTEQLPEALKSLVDDLASEAVKPGLKLAARGARAWHKAMDKVATDKPKLMGAVDKLGFKIKVKVNAGIVLKYSRFFSRAKEVAGILDRYANEGIKPRRRDIIGFVSATGPTMIEVPASIAVALGVDAAVEAGPTDIPLDLFVELADLALKELGVPE